MTATSIAKPVKNLSENKFNVDEMVVAGTFFAIMIFGQKFTHLGFGRLYAVEFIIILLSLSLALSYLLSSHVRQKINLLATRQLAPLSLLIALGTATLIACIDNGFLAFRQSLITLYAGLVFIYIFAFKSEESLQRFLLISLLFFSFYISAKLMINLHLGLTHEDEPYRVKHDEVDAIFSALALLGIAAYRKPLINSHKMLFFIVIFLNASILLLTIKRTAIIGLFAGLIFIFLREKIYQQINRRHVAFTLLVLVVSIAIGLGVFREQLDLAINIAVKKINVLNENNSTWRLQAWQVALDDFRNSPIWGNGYGHRILKTSIKGVDTMDPHNSYLALLAYNGVIGFSLLIATIFISLKKYFQLLQDPQDADRKNLIHFFCASLLFMIVYAFFNVTLEVQRLALFFWFFVGGSFLIDRLKTEIPAEREKAHVFSLNALKGIFIIIALSIYFVSLNLPQNHIKRIDIYLAENQGQYPEVVSPVTDGARIIRNQSDFTVILDAQDTSTFTELNWILPSDLHQIKGKETDYFIVFKLAGNVGSDISFQFRTFEGQTIGIENLSTDSRQITIPLEAIRDIDLNSIYGMSLIIPHGSSSKAFTFRQISVELLNWREEYPLHSKSGPMREPHLNSRHPDSAYLASTDGRIDLGMAGISSTGFATLSWLLPDFAVDNYFGASNSFVEIQLASSIDAEGVIVQIQNSENSIELENITANSTKITGSLAQLEPTLFNNQHSMLSIHFPYEADPRNISIDAVTIAKRPEHFDSQVLFDSSRSRNPLPMVFTENTDAAITTAITSNGLSVHSHKIDPGWSTLFWRLPGLQTIDTPLSDLYLIISYENSANTNRLSYGFTADGQYLPATQYESDPDHNTVIIPLAYLDPEKVKPNLDKPDIGFNISTDYNPHTETFIINSIRIVSRDDRSSKND